MRPMCPWEKMKARYIEKMFSYPMIRFEDTGNTKGTTSIDAGAVGGSPYGSKTLEERHSEAMGRERNTVMPRNYSANKTSDCVDSNEICLK